MGMLMSGLAAKAEKPMKQRAPTAFSQRMPGRPGRRMLLQSRIIRGPTSGSSGLALPIESLDRRPHREHRLLVLGQPSDLLDNPNRDRRIAL